MCSTPRRNTILRQPTRQSSKIVGASSSASVLAKADGREAQLKKARALRRQKKAEKTQPTSHLDSAPGLDSKSNKNNNMPSLLGLIVGKLSYLLSHKTYS